MRSIIVKDTIHGRLMTIKKAYGFASMTETIIFLLDNTIYTSLKKK